MTRTEEEKCTEKCTCYQDRWVRESLGRLAGILELGENYKLMGGDKNDQNWGTECPLCHKGKKTGMDEQYAFEQAILQEKPEMQKLRLRAVPAPCLYKKGSGSECKNGWCRVLCPDLILFSKLQQKLWVVEVRTSKRSGGLEKQGKKIFDLIPMEWRLEVVRVRLEEGLKTPEAIKSYFNIGSSDSPSLVSLITGEISGKLSRMCIGKKAKKSVRKS